MQIPSAVPVRITRMKARNTDVDILKDKAKNDGISRPGNADSGSFQRGKLGEV